MSKSLGKLVGLKLKSKTKGGEEVKALVLPAPPPPLRDRVRGGASLPPSLAATPWPSASSVRTSYRWPGCRMITAKGVPFLFFVPKSKPRRENPLLAKDRRWERGDQSSSPAPQ